MNAKYVIKFYDLSSGRFIGYFTDFTDSLVKMAPNVTDEQVRTFASLKEANDCILNIAEALGFTVAVAEEINMDEIILASMISNVVECLDQTGDMPSAAAMKDWLETNYQCGNRIDDFMAKVFRQASEQYQN